MVKPETDESYTIKSEPQDDLDERRRKRSRVEDSEDEEEELPTKKHRHSVQSEVLNQSSEIKEEVDAEVISKKNNADDNDDCPESKQDDKCPSDSESSLNNIDSITVEEDFIKKEEDTENEVIL